MIRILQMIGSLDVGGSQMMIINLYKKINRDEMQFDFIIDHKEQLYFEKEIKQLGGKVFYIPSIKSEKITNVRQKWENFLKKHPEYKILHSHVRSYASVYIPIARKYGLKTIIHSHSTSNGKGISAIVKRIMQYPLRFQADYFFSCSKEAGEWLFGKKVVNGEKYHMLQNAIDVQKYMYDENQRKKSRVELKIEDNTIVFMHIGRLHEAKNHFFLLEVFAEYQKKYKNSVLVIVGDGELRNGIENKIQSMNLNSNVKMLGARKDVPNLLQAADCFLFPSKWEGLPVTVVEAQAAGLPCLVSDTVTRDVNVSELVKNLSIKNGIEPWINAMENLKFDRKDVSEDIRMAGFDIEESAKWLSDFYMRLVKNE